MLNRRGESPRRRSLEREVCVAQPALSEATVPLPSGPDAVSVLGQHDVLLAVLEAELSVALTFRGDHLVVRGTPEQVEVAVGVVEELVRMARRGHSITPT